jgi:nucleoid-associated protein YgaU
MSLRRLAGTAGCMGLVAIALSALTPTAAEMAAALASAQRTADTSGPDSLVIAAAGLLAWAVWAWGVVGLALTAASALPGAVGSLARLATHVVLPAGARTPAARAPSPPPAPAPSPASPPADDQVPDWPTDPPDVAEGSHVVLRGDCLWHIAEARLRQASGQPPTSGEIARAVHAWWSANAEVIGPDPDLLLPGQVLRPPDPA